MWPTSLWWLLSPAKLKCQSDSQKSVTVLWKTSVPNSILMKFKQNKILLEVFILKGSKTQVCQPRRSIPSQDIQRILLSKLAPLSFCSVSAPPELSWSCGVLPHCRIQPYQRNLLRVKEECAEIWLTGFRTCSCHWRRKTWMRAGAGGKQPLSWYPKSLFLPSNKLSFNLFFFLP